MTASRRRLLLWPAFVLAAALSYLWGLGGLYLPKFGDEMVYAHIARMTAESGHWLPLQSDYPHLRNTKPPLLFWQAMVAGQWGANWTPGALRLPSVLYTWTTALVAGLLAARLWRLRAPLPAAAASRPGHDTPSWVVGCVAAAAYLLFFSTIRYNRTYLTSGPETFWMFFAIALLAWAPARMLASRLWFPLAAGLAIGLACLYKSFVLAVPMGLALLLCHLFAREGAQPRWTARRLAVPALKAAASALLGVALFSLWFVLDPVPGDIWREFIVGENVGRLSGGPGYVETALGAPSGFWVILVACFSNAGLLLPVVAGAAAAAWRAARAGAPVSAGEKVLWLWLLALTLFFLVPSQRTSRYLIPAMPAVAILVALYWGRIHRGWFLASIALSVGTAAVLAAAALGGGRALSDPGLYPPAFWLLPAAAVAAGVAGALRGPLARPASLVAAMAPYLAMTALYSPFNGALGQFNPDTVRALAGRPVAVANQFTGQSEQYRFLLPGVPVQAVKAPPTRTQEDLDRLFAVAPYALVERWPGEAVCAGCRVVDARWLPGSRPGASAWDALLRPQTYWFSREYLVERPGA